MDPRWDLYGEPRIDRDVDVESRDRRIERERRRNVSPWEIGQRHWNQRDTYTKNARVDDGGYGLGPAFHPEVGSWAYQRSAPPYDHPAPAKGREQLYEKEAWPLGAPVRSDRSIHDDACAALTDDAWVDASDIEVTVEKAEVTLKGTVTDRETKKRAEEIVSGIVGVIDVHNRLTIRKDDDDGVAFTMPVLTAS